MSWIQTFTGKKFFPDRPEDAEFDIHDIAHALSLLCRFNGHCAVFYSVAEHSVRVSRVCSAQTARWGLLHDLGEAYLGDLPRPIKAHMPLFSEFEDALLRAAAQAFDLSWPMPAEVKRADNVMLSTEFRDVMAQVKEPWPVDEPPLDERIIPLNPIQAEEEFLMRFKELF